MKADISGLSDEEIVKRYGGDLSGSNVVALLRHDDGSFDIFKTHNRVVTTGLQYYAQKIGGVNPTNAFNTCVLGNPSSNDTIALGDNYSDLGSPITASKKTITSNYPQLNNQDSDNTGRGQYVYTWKFEWGSSDFNTEGANNVRSGVITLATATGSNPILNHWNFATAFPKLSTSALILWVNHSLSSVADA